MAELDAAGLLYNRNRLDEASRRCLRILASEPEHHGALLLLAMIERRRKNYGTAVELAHRALNSKPNYPDTYVCLAAIYRDFQEPAVALQHIRRGIALNPNNFAAVMVQAAIYDDLRNVTELERSLLRAIELNNCSSDAYDSLGKLKAEQGKNAEAEAYYWRAIKIHPDWIDYWFHLAEVHEFYQGDPIIAEYEKLAKIQSLTLDDRIRAQFALGWALDQAGHFDRAFQYFKEANAEKASILYYDASQQHQQVEDILRINATRPSTPPPADPSNLGHIPIFIVGLPRSGKTLLETLMAERPGVLPLGEAKLLISCLRRLLQSSGVEDSMHRALAKLDSTSLAKLNQLYLNHVLEINPQATHSINTLPGNYLYVGWLLDVMPGAKVIFCQRDPLDCCLQIFFKYFDHGHSYSYQFDALADYYLSYNKLLDYWRERYGHRILQIRYEDLVTATEGTLAKVWSYCGLDPNGPHPSRPLNVKQIGHWQNYYPWIGPLIERLDRCRDLPIFGGQR